MKTDITQNYIETIREAIDKEDSAYLKAEAEELHPADIALILKDLKLSHAQYFFGLLDKEKSGDVLIESEDSLRHGLLEAFNAEEIVRTFIDELDSDDAADLVNELPDAKKEEVIDYLNKSEEESDQEVVNLLRFEEDTAGGLMATELIRVNLNWKVSECISEVRRQAEEIESLYAVYVIDDSDTLLGFVPLKSLILCEPDIFIRDVYNKEVIPVEEDTPADEVADIMKKYDLVSLPVIDKNGKLVGRITIDDVVDFLQEEAEEDYQLMSGISEDVEYSDRVWVLSRARLPWLLLGLMGGVASARVISLNEEAIKIYPEMAFFIPLIAAMGGNAGVQSSAIVVQGLASKSLGTGSYISKLGKEFLVSLVNGIICSAVLLGYGLIFHDGLNLVFTISLSLLAVIVIASTFGITIPLVLNKLKIDPALATGPFITTTNDLIGLGVYFAIGRLLYSFSF